jgi:hypothetical protein
MSEARQFVRYLERTRRLDILEGRHLYDVDLPEGVFAYIQRLVAYIYRQWQLLRHRRRLINIACRRRRYLC